MGGTNVGVCGSCCFFVFNVRRSRDLSTQLERLRFPPKMGGAAFSKLINGFSLPFYYYYGEGGKGGGKFRKRERGRFIKALLLGRKRSLTLFE